MTDSNRFLVVGLNRFGRALVSTLWRAKCEVVAVDESSEHVDEVKDLCSAVFIADGTDPKVLAQVGAAEVDTAVVTFGEHFEASVLAVSSLRDLGVKRIVARAVSDQKARILRAVGASRVVQPDAEAGERLGLDLVSHVATDLLDFAAEFRVLPWIVAPRLAGKELREVELFANHRIHALGIRRARATTIELPDPTARLATGDTLIVAGADDDVTRFVRSFD